MNDKQDFDLPFESKEPKDLKFSIRRKYQRRERDLWMALEQFIIQAEERLDPEKAGDIRDRETVEKLKSLAEDLFNEIDTPKEFQEDLNFDPICRALNIDDEAQ